MTSHLPEIERWSGLKVWMFGLFNRTPKSNIAAVEWLTLVPGDRFLDMGCGLGAALEHALGTDIEVAGVDPSPTMVEKASSRVPGAVVKLGSAEAIPFPDDAFSAAMAVSTFHHWADPEAGLSEMRRVLSRGGRLLIVEGKLKKGEGHGLDAVMAESVAARLREKGFASVEVDEKRVGRHDYLAVSASVPE